VYCSLAPDASATEASSSDQDLAGESKLTSSADIDEGSDKVHLEFNGECVADIRSQTVETDLDKAVTACDIQQIEGKPSEDSLATSFCVKTDEEFISSETDKASDTTLQGDPTPQKTEGLSRISTCVDKGNSVDLYCAVDRPAVAEESSAELDSNLESDGSLPVAGTVNVVSANIPEIDSAHPASASMSDDVSQPSSPPIAVAKGNYNINWDEFDDSVNPFQPRKRLSSSPPTSPKDGDLPSGQDGAAFQPARRLTRSPPAKQDAPTSASSPSSRKKVERRSVNNNKPEPVVDGVTLDNGVDKEETATAVNGPPVEKTETNEAKTDSNTAVK
jgi:hypothetical protein